MLSDAFCKAPFPLNSIADTFCSGPAAVRFSEIIPEPLIPSTADTPYALAIASNSPTFALLVWIDAFIDGAWLV